MTIEKFPQPPRVTPYEGAVLDAEETVKKTLMAVLPMGPAIFNDALPNTFTIATSKHIILCAFSVGGESSEEAMSMAGLDTWLDEVLEGHTDEVVTAITLCVPMSDLLLVHGWDASGHTAYTIIEPGPYPGVLAIGALHCHMPPRAPDLPPDEDYLVEHIIAASGRHLWGSAWALLPGSEDGC